MVACRAEYDRLNNSEVTIVENKGKTKIGLIIGHNSKSQGKRIFGSSEYEFWKEFLYENIDGWNFSGELKIFERPAGVSYPAQMREVQGQCDAWGANITVECHFNAASANVNGHEVLYYNRSKGGKAVANIFNKAMTSELSNNDRGEKPAERGSYGLKIGKAKSILVEPFFAKKLKSYQIGGKYRQALVNSFQVFFDLIEHTNERVESVKPVLTKRNSEFTDEELRIIGMIT